MCYPTKVAVPPASGHVPVIATDPAGPRDLDRCLAEMRDTLIQVAIARHTGAR